MKRHIFHKGEQEKEGVGETRRMPKRPKLLFEHMGFQEEQFSRRGSLKAHIFREGEKEDEVKREGEGKRETGGMPKRFISDLMGR